MQVNNQKQFQEEKNSKNMNPSVELQVRESAFEKRIHTFAIVNNNHGDILEFMRAAFPIYQSELLRNLEVHNIVKSMTILVAEFEKQITTINENDASNGSEERTIKETLYFPTPNMMIDLTVDLNEHFQTNIIEEITKCVENTAIRGSGFTLSRIIELNVNICSYQPLSGSSFIETPRKIKLKKALVNVRNEEDHMCFMWAILSALHPAAKNQNRLTHYLKYRNELNFNGIEFPVRLNDIDKFERLNSSISVNVYFYNEEDDLICPLRVSTEIKRHHIHLLLIFKTNHADDNNMRTATTTASKIKLMLDDGQIQSHYCWIKCLSRLVSSQLNSHGHKNYICDRCLNYFELEEKLNEHMENCTSEYQVRMPNDADKWLIFKNYEHQLKAPIIVYADTEALLKRLDANERNRVFSEKCSTEAYQEHRVYSVGYYMKCEFNDSESHYASKTGIDCVEWFAEELEKIAEFAARSLAMNEPIKMTAEDENVFKDPNANCAICGIPFEADEMRVRDHCHFSGKFRGAAHSKCNREYQESRIIPVIFHNLSGYDAHLLIKKIALKITGETSIIPVNAEQYISFTQIVWKSNIGMDVREKIRLRFIDSFRFMSESLSKLVSLIPMDKKRILYSTCRGEYSSEQLSMLERKGVFPYDYVDSYERLAETSLPSIDHFYSELNEEKILPEEYEFACQIWEKFQLKTLGEYSDLYLKTDVLLLADVFENFRETCHKIYKLDPAHYYTAPGLSFDAMLKYTGVKIELLTDIEMLLFIERGIRGGISQCSKRYVKANNKYMKTEYKAEEKTNYLMYLDGTILFIHFFIILCTCCMLHMFPFSFSFFFFNS